MQCMIGRHGFNGGNTAGINVKVSGQETPEHFRVTSRRYIKSCLLEGDCDEVFDFIMSSIFFMKDKKKNDAHRLKLIREFLPWVLEG